MGGNSSGMGKRTGGMQRPASAVFLNEPGDAKLAKDLRNIFSNPAYAVDGNDDPFTMYVKATGYGDKDRSLLTGWGVSKPSPVAEDVDMYGELRAVFAPEDAGRAEWLLRKGGGYSDEMLQELGLTAPATEAGAVCRLYHVAPKDGRVPPDGRGANLRVSILPERRIETRPPFATKTYYVPGEYETSPTRILTEDRAERLLRNFEAKHGSITSGALHGTDGARAAETRRSAMAALAAAKGIDIIRADHPTNKYEYRVLNRGVLRVGEYLWSNADTGVILKHFGKVKGDTRRDLQFTREGRQWQRQLKKQGVEV